MAKRKKYEVGYCKPPLHTQFAKGQSGNPRGRPKGSLNLTTALNKALKETVTVIENGKRKQITKLDAAVKGLINRAVKGDAKAMQQLIGLAPLVGAETTGGLEPMGSADSAVMENLIKRLQAPTGSSSDEK